MTREQNPRAIMKFPLGNFPLRFGSFPSLWEDWDQNFLENFNEQRGLSVWEDKTHFFVEAAVPGLNNNEIDVTLDRGVLMIKGEKKEEMENKEKRFYSKMNCSFSYRIALPGQINEVGDPQAQLKDGVLRLTFEKAPQNQTRKINIH